MPVEAKHAAYVRIGECAHDNERQAIRFIVQGLPENYTVYGNPWLVERTGVIYELDAVVVAPHAVFVVEIKSYRGRVEGTDNDWYVPNAISSPLKLNRKTAQILKSELKRRSFLAGQVWVEGLVFLSATTDVNIVGAASKERIHTRQTILAALQDEGLIERLSGRRQQHATGPADRELYHLFTEERNKGTRPVRRVREYEIVRTLDHQDNFSELLGKNSLSGTERVLRIYSIPPLATDEQRDRIMQRARWEAQVLGRLGRGPSILSADPPFTDEAGIVLPLELFKGITLTTWLTKYVGDGSKPKSDLRARTDLWIRICQAIDFAHRQGVVHRLLRPDVVLAEDKPDPKQVRVTGFDLAKQTSVGSLSTAYHTALSDDRLVYAAPEVVRNFSSAEPASDQFSLGAILGLLLAGKPLFESTRQLLADRRLLRRVRDMAQRIPLSLDEAVQKMIAIRPADRYANLLEALAAVRTGRDPERPLLLPGMAKQKPLDADNLEPDTRIGTDYEIISRLGEGGMAVVYAARHIVSGRTRALKIAHSDHAAEEALQGEFRVLDALDHPNIVRVIDLSKMVEGRFTLVMERVGGHTLRQWLARHPQPEPATQRRFAEDLLAGLDYLEKKGVTHKDLKPENLLVGDGGLTIIDFSLAERPEDDPYGGTALYRDPSSLTWTHGTDRFAAALCLFELYAGRHAFEGRVPEPGEGPTLSAEDIQPSGLAAFFEKALAAVPEKRFPSARAMRDAFLLALGVDLTEQATPSSPQDVNSSTPLRLAGLSPRAVKKLAGIQIHTVGDLLTLPPSHVRAIHAIGTKTARDIIAFQESLRALGVSPASSNRAADPPVVPSLVDSPEPVQKLPLPPRLLTALDEGGCPTVGAVASLTADELLRISGIGRTRLAQVVEALHGFAARTPEASGNAHTLDRFWELASRPLSDAQRTLVERSLGIGCVAESGTDISADLGRSAAQISSDVAKGLERLDRTMLADASSALDNLLDGFGGIVRLEKVALRLEEEWPAGVVSGLGFVRLLVRVSFGRAHIIDVDGDNTLVARPVYDRDTMRAFTAEVMRIAEQWPPLEPDSARRTLAALLPQFDGDPLALGVRLCEDIGVTETGHLFLGPLDARRSIEFVMERTRGPIDFDELERSVRRTFGEDAPLPDRDHLIEILQSLECNIQGNNVLPAGHHSFLAPPPLLDDDAIAAGGVRTAESVVRDMLLDASRSRGFRMLITPPERHPEIGRSVAEALNATWISFDDVFFRQHASQLAALERAERFVAQRELLTEAAEEVMDELLEKYGRAGQSIVLGDTALLGLCGALDLPRRLYDTTLSGSHGFWVLVVPGVMHNRQPHFNEREPMWHLEGSTMTLTNPLTAKENR